MAFPYVGQPLPGGNDPSWWEEFCTVFKDLCSFLFHASAVVLGILAAVTVVGGGIFLVVWIVVQLFRGLIWLI